jgi:AraC-like DNA-binding protein
MVNILLNKGVANSVPMYRVMQMLEGAKRSGVKVEELLAECGIPIEYTEQPDAKVDKKKCIDLMLAVMRRTEDEFMGFGGGPRSKPGTFSMMAHAVINCPTLEKALQRSQQFYGLFDYPIRSFAVVESDQFKVVYQTKRDSEFRAFILESLMFIVLRFMSWLIGQQIVPKHIAFDFEPTSEDREYGDLFPCPVLFSQDENVIVMDKRYMDHPLVQNELSLSKFLKSSLEELIDGNIQNASLNAQIRSIISEEYGNCFPDFSVVCDKLNMTPQTLRRRLKDENTSYQDIKDTIRKDASVYYLAKPELSIDEIALLMGFSEASSFHRAFKKWTSKTPSAYRQELMEQSKRFNH